MFSLSLSHRWIIVTNKIDLVFYIHLWQVKMNKELDDVFTMYRPFETNDSLLSIYYVLSCTVNRNRDTIFRVFARLSTTQRCDVCLCAMWDNILLPARNVTTPRAIRYRSVTNMLSFSQKTPNSTKIPANVTDVNIASISSSNVNKLQGIIR